MDKTCLNLSKSCFLWPNLETLVETIPCYVLPADSQCLFTKFMIVINYNKGRSSRSQMFIKIAVLKNFAIFARKHLWWILFIINLFNKNTYLKLKFNESVFWSWNIIILNLLWKMCIYTYTVVTRQKKIQSLNLDCQELSSVTFQKVRASVWERKS